MVVKGYEKKQLLDFYKTMLTIRRFEEQTFEFYKRGLMAGLAHLYMGEEAVATGVCGALNEKDYIGSTHRGHGHLIARGADLDKMMAEILGKKTGYSNGKGGSMHIMAMDKGILGANGIVGGENPIATGAAYSAKYRKTDQVSIAFLGDGASNEGTFHESVNMAAAWHLPCIYVIENNLYGISVDIRDVTNTPDLSVRAKGYNIPGVTVDGMDVTAVYEAAKEAVARARAGEGPTIIEAKTYRWQGHHVGDPAVYRSRKSKTEKEDWMKKDPIKNLKAAMMEENLASADEFEKIEADVEADIAAAAKFAEESDYPAAEDAFNNIFA